MNITQNYNENLLVIFDYLPENQAKQAQAQLESRFQRARYMIHIEMDKLGDKDAVDYMLKEFRKRQIGPNDLTKRVIYAFLHDYSVDASDKIQKSINVIRSLSEIQVVLQNRLILHFAYIGNGNRRHTTAQQDNVKKLAAGFESYQNQRLFLLEDFVSKTTPMWKNEIVFLDLLRRLDANQIGRVFPGTLGQDNLGFIACVDYDEKIFNERAEKVAELRWKLGEETNSDGQDKFQNVLARSCEDIEAQLSQRYEVTPLLQPICYDLVKKNNPWCIFGRKQSDGNSLESSRQAVVDTIRDLRKAVVEEYVKHASADFLLQAMDDARIPFRIRNEGDTIEKWIKNNAAFTDRYPDFQRRSKVQEYENQLVDCLRDALADALKKGKLAYREKLVELYKKMDKTHWQPEALNMLRDDLVEQAGEMTNHSLEYLQDLTVGGNYLCRFQGRIAGGHSSVFRLVQDGYQDQAGGGATVSFENDSEKEIDGVPIKAFFVSLAPAQNNFDTLV